MASDTGNAKKSLWTRFKSSFQDSFYSQYILSNKTSIENLLIGLVVFALEELLNDKVFLCPAHHYKTYGDCFQFVPLVCLFFLNLLVIVDHSCLSIFTFPCVKRYRRESLSYGVGRDIFLPFLLTVVASSVGPVVWVISSMIRGRFYVCAHTGYDVYLRPNITRQFVYERLKSTALENITTEEYEILVRDHESEAHTVGWAFLIVLVACGTLSLLWNQCFLKDEQRMMGMMEYEKREAIAAFAQFKHWADNKRDEEAEEPVMKAKGLPEIAGREMVLFLIEKAKSGLYKDSKYHDKNIFVEVYDDIIALYPRGARGNLTLPYRWSLDHDFEGLKDDAEITPETRKERQEERRRRAKYLLEIFFQHKMAKNTRRDVGVNTERSTEEDRVDGGVEHLGEEHAAREPGILLDTPRLDTAEAIEMHELEPTERDNLLVTA